MPRRLPPFLALATFVAASFAVAAAGQGASGAAGPPGGSPPGLAQAIAAQERNRDRLLDLPGVAGVGVGVNGAGRAVIRIYKERPDVAGLPDSLDGVGVQSITTGIIEPRAPTDRFPRPVPIGVSSGLQDIATGTLGVRVTDGANVYALSNNHVYAGINTANIGDGIIQPGAVDGGSDPADRIGTLSAYQPIDFNAGSTNTIDAALALTSTANVGTSTPPDGYGTPSPVTAPAFIGQAVQKYGRTTGLQLGNVADVNVSVDVCYLLLFNFCLEQARFVDQISVSPGTFSDAGDSGSLIVTQGGNQPVALLFAGGDGLTIGNPIDLVLQHFGVTIDGAPPGNGPPGAPTGLSALAGDGSVALSWNAPAFDGGSAITNYKVYRGTSSGGETFLADAGTATSYTDTSALNGTTYYYEVSAENANGEGSLSGEASATPVAAVLPSEPLPTLDNFDRGFENPLSDSGRWSNGVNGSGEAGLYIPSTWLACSKSTTCTAWRNDAQVGPDSEVWARVSVLPGDGNQVRLYARLQQPGTSGFDGYMLRTTQLAGTDELYLERVDNGAFVRLLTLKQELQAGDLLLLRASGSTIEAWRDDGSSWSRLGTVSDSTYAAAGYVGLGLRGTTGRLDDFGARTMGAASAPSAPQSLQATAGDAQVSLAWSAPASDGGSPLTGYTVYRGTSPSPTTALASGLLSASYLDTTAANGSTYYYRVSASNAVGESGYSNEVSATPSAAVVTPVEPLPVVDSFDRRNENPLSDSGRWSNGVVGSSEAGLRVVSKQLGCTKTTTCTAWRNPATFGPDTEVWATVATLPGTNNGIRLYARLQQPGSSAYDGYMLRTTQLAGTDEVSLGRIDDSTVVPLLSIGQELSVGDTVLLRVQGSRLEAWRRSGTSWSELGTVDDSTYGGVGYVGIGLSGKTGRLDDFGAR